MAADIYRTPQQMVAASMMRPGGMFSPSNQGGMFNPSFQGSISPSFQGGGFSPPFQGGGDTNWMPPINPGPGVWPSNPGNGMEPTNTPAPPPVLNPTLPPGGPNTNWMPRPGAVPLPPRTPPGFDPNGTVDSSMAGMQRPITPGMMRTLPGQEWMGPGANTNALPRMGMGGNTNVLPRMSNPTPLNPAGGFGQSNSFMGMGGGTGGFAGPPGVPPIADPLNRPPARRNPQMGATLGRGPFSFNNIGRALFGG